MLNDHLRLDKIANIKLQVEGLHDDCLRLGIIELLEEVLGVTLELHHALVIAHTALHLEDLAHHVE